MLGWDNTDRANAVATIKRLVKERNKLLRERSYLRGWLRWAIARIDANAPSVFVNADIRKLARRGRR